jgi:hypothetical protein
MVEVVADLTEVLDGTTCQARIKVEAAHKLLEVRVTQMVRREDVG